MSFWKVVRPAVWTGFRVTSRLYLTLRGRKYRYVFILGHMRSGSTLLSHILASHPDVSGAGETHISYKTAEDLPKLVLKTCELLHRPFLFENYIVDQINHPYVTDEVLDSASLYRCIILLREPAATLKSLMKLLRCRETDALNVYIERIGTLIHYGLFLKHRAMLVEYDDLVNHSEETLAAITNFLALETPLTPTYETHRMTRRVGGYGDPSQNIKAGQIIRTKGHGITISKETLTTATRAFEECRQRLKPITTKASLNAARNVTIPAED